jgi:hypothetical protein
MGLLGHERALFVHRSQASRLDEFCELQGSDARAVPFRRSLGDAAGGRTAVLGVSIEPEILTITPTDAGVSKIGHFGFFRPEQRDILWRGAAEWIQAAE